MSIPTVPVFSETHALNAHTTPINVLSISPDGSRLLSGSDDTLLVIWNIEDGTQRQTIGTAFNGPISCAVWTPLLPERPTSAFAFGCANGTVFVYSEIQNNYQLVSNVLVHDGAIEDIAFDPHHNRIATAGGGCLKLWDMNLNGQLTERAASVPSPLIARSVAFFDKGTHVLVCFLESHEVVGYQVEPFLNKWSYQLATRISHARISSDERHLLVTNLNNGLDTYSIPLQHGPLRSFVHPIHRNVPLLVSNMRDSLLTVVGSDDGAPRVYDQRAGVLSASLAHGGVGTLVQVVASFSKGDHCIIVTGASDPDATSTSIKLWNAIPPTPTEFSPNKRSGRLSTSLIICQVILVVIITVAVQVLVAKFPLDPALAYAASFLPPAHIGIPVNVNCYERSTLTVSFLPI